MNKDEKNFKKKYLKYKIKYLSAKKNLIGGDIIAPNCDNQTLKNLEKKVKK